MKVLFESWREHHEALIYLSEERRYLAFRLFDDAPIPVSINNHDVPIFKSDKINLSKVPLDISFQHLIHRIDGFSHVKKISSDADMDTDFVKASLTLLAFHDCIIISDVFKFSNIYKLDVENFRKFIVDPREISALRDFCIVSSSELADYSFADQVVLFISKLRQGFSIRQILMENIDSLDLLKNIDLSRMLAFLSDKKVVTRVHEFPMYTKTLHCDHEGEEGSGSSNSNSNGGVSANRMEYQVDSSQVTPDDNKAFPKLSRSKSVLGRSYLKSSACSQISVKTIVEALTGEECLDSLCCRYEVSYDDIVNYPGVHLVYK